MTVAPISAIGNGFNPPRTATILYLDPHIARLRVEIDRRIRELTEAERGVFVLQCAVAIRNALPRFEHLFRMDVMSPETPAHKASRLAQAIAAYTSTSRSRHGVIHAQIIELSAQLVKLKEFREP